MAIYIAMFRIKFINALQYRVGALGGMATGIAWGFMEIVAFGAFYRVNPAAFPMEFSQTVSYIWMQQALLPLFMMLFWENDIINAIIEGSIVYEMVRPINLYNRWFTQASARRLASAALRCLPMLIIAFIIPEPYRLHLPPVKQLILFIFSTALSLGVVVSFSMLIYISLFYTLSPSGLGFIPAVLADFLMGSIIPLPFFPEPFRTVAELLPFAAMSNMPLRIYSGNIAGIDAYKGIVLQLFWLAAFLLIGRFSLKQALKKVVVQGG